MRWGPQRRAPRLLPRPADCQWVLETSSPSLKIIDLFLHSLNIFKNIPKGVSHYVTSQDKHSLILKLPDLSMQ